MTFVGPDKKISDIPPPSRDFAAGPDNPNLQVTTNSPPPDENPIGEAITKLVSPIKALFKGPDRLIENQAKEMTTPDNPQERSGYGKDALAFERSKDYPTSLYTDPTVSDAANAYGAAEMGMTGAKAGMIGAKALLKGEVPKIASGAFIGPDALQGELPGVPTATTKDVENFTSTAKTGDILPVGGGNSVTYKGVQPGVEGVIPDQPMFDLHGKNLPPQYAEQEGRAHTFVGPDRLADEGIVNKAEPLQLYPATRTPEGFESGHTWGPYQKRVMETKDLAMRKAIMDEAQKNVGFVDDTGKFYTVQEFSDLQTAGKAKALNMARGKPLNVPAPLPTPETTPISPAPHIMLSDQDLGEINRATGTKLVRPSAKIQLSQKDVQDINQATGMNLSVKVKQPELPMKMGTSKPPIIPTDPIVKGFSDEMAMGKIKDRFVPGVSDMNRQFSLVATNPETASTGSLQQLKNSITQAEVRVGTQYNNYLKQLNGMGIEPGSKESSALFNYIEGNLSDTEINEILGKSGAKKVKSASAFMRDQYDQWLDEINEIRGQRGLKPISKKANYINHMDQMSSVGEDLISKIKGDADLAEKAQTAMAQQEQYRVAEPDVSFKHIIRKGGDTAEDAITSFRKYIYDALNYRELAPEVDRINQIANLARANKMTNLANRLEDYAGYVAGKPELLDKLAADTVGKTTLSLVHKLSKGVTYSVISFNPSVWAAQMIRLFPKFMNEGFLNGNLMAGVKFFDSAARTEAFENVPFLQKMFLNREEAAITGGFGGIGIKQSTERLGANIPAYVDQAFAMHTAILSHDAKLAELVSKYPLTDKAVLDKQAWLYAEHNIERYQALISKSATPPYFRSKTSKILTPLMREASLMTDFIYRDILKNNGDLGRAQQVARGVAGLSAMAIMGSVMETLGGEDQKPLLGKALFPMLKALESSMAMVKTAAAPLTAAKAYVEGKGTLGNVALSTAKTAILARGTPGGLQLIKFLEGLFGD